MLKPTDTPSGHPLLRSKTTYIWRFARRAAFILATRCAVLVLRAPSHQPL